jgi:acyl carrier protein
MNKESMLKEINSIFIDVLDDDTIIINEKTTSNDVEEWDSLTHIQLVIAIEKNYGVRFTSEEIQKWTNVGEMISCIISKKI